MFGLIETSLTLEQIGLQQGRRPRPVATTAGQRRHQFERTIQSSRPGLGPRLLQSSIEGRAFVGGLPLVASLGCQPDRLLQHVSRLGETLLAQQGQPQSALGVSVVRGLLEHLLELRLGLVQPLLLQAVVPLSPGLGRLTFRRQGHLVGEQLGDLAILGVRLLIGGIQMFVCGGRLEPLQRLTPGAIGGRIAGRSALGQALDTLATRGFTIAQHLAQRGGQRRLVGMFTRHRRQALASLAPAIIGAGQGQVDLRRQPRRNRVALEHRPIAGHGLGVVARRRLGAGLGQPLAVGTPQFLFLRQRLDPVILRSHLGQPCLPAAGLFHIAIGQRIFRQQVEGTPVARVGIEHPLEGLLGQIGALPIPPEASLLEQRRQGLIGPLGLGRTLVLRQHRKGRQRQ